MTHPRSVCEVVEALRLDGEFDLSYDDGGFTFSHDGQPYAQWTITPGELDKAARSNGRASRDAWGDRSASGTHLVIAEIYETLHTGSAGPRSLGSWQFFT